LAAHGTTTHANAMNRPFPEKRHPMPADGIAWYRHGTALHNTHAFVLREHPNKAMSSCLVSGNNNTSCSPCQQYGPESFQLPRYPRHDLRWRADQTPGLWGYPAKMVQAQTVGIKNLSCSRKTERLILTSRTLLSSYCSTRSIV
jgi:hypothetical protein